MLTMAPLFLREPNPGGDSLKSPAESISSLLCVCMEVRKALYLNSSSVPPSKIFGLTLVCMFLVDVFETIPVGIPAADILLKEFGARALIFARVPLVNS